MSQRKGPHWRTPEQKALKNCIVKIKTLLSSERNSNIHLGTVLLSCIHSVFFKALLWQFYKLILTHSIFTPKLPPSSFTHFQNGLKLNLLGSSWNQVFQRAFWAWPCSDSTDTPVVRTGSLCPALSARTHTIQASTKSGKFSTFQEHPFSLNKWSLILLSQLSAGSSLCAALEGLAGNKPHGTPARQDQGYRDPMVPCWEPTPEPFHNHTRLLQLQIPREGAKGKNKNRKDGRKGKTKTQRETILWKSMKWDSKTSVWWRHSTSWQLVLSQEMPHTQSGTWVFK